MTATKLELMRPGKNKSFDLEPRILIEKPELSYGDKDTENMLIHGDNLLALKALEQQYTGKVKCIFIDPPYNTGSAFEHYDDGVEHTLRLNLMKTRLEYLRNLLTNDGSIYVSIDFNEVHYLKIIMDEIFGRDCFQREIIWRMGWLSGYKTMAKNYIRNHDTILYYTKSPTDYYFNKELAYNKYDDFQERFNDDSKKKIKAKLKENRGVSDDEAKDFIDFVSKVGLPERYPLEDTWNCSIYDKLNSINVVSFAGEKVSKLLGVSELKGQKSEALIHRILNISTEPGDLVLDSFLGTGTTCAVAHKMGRKWIGIELGDHCYTHCKPRLDLIINNGDQTGISKIVGREGGGGYKFYELGPSVLLQDKYGNYIINPNFNSSELVQALCKIENFTYKAFEDNIKHGYSTEKDFIHVTTRHITQEIIKDIQETSLKEGETMLIVAKTFESNLDLPDNIQIKKIPAEILNKCEYNKDDYSLPITKEEIADED